MNCIEMFIKVAIVILLSVEIEACGSGNSPPPSPNSGTLLLRDPFTKKAFLK